MFTFGTQYFRPTNPPRKDRKSDLKQIAELGMNTVKLSVCWGYHNPREGQFDYEELMEIMTECEKLGLRVILQILLEGAPYWIESKYPEARFVNVYGRPMTLEGNSCFPSGGTPGLCFDHPEVLHYAKIFLTDIAGAFVNSKSLLAWDCWNEPHVEPVWSTNFWAGGDLGGSDNKGERMFCYCPSTINEFRKWVRARYKDDLALLNKTWVRNFSSWAETFPPRRHGTYSDWLDWRRFMVDRNSYFMRCRYEAIREVDPSHLIVSHAGIQPPMGDVAELGIDGWKLADCVDRWGISLFPRGHTPAFFPRPLVSMALSCARSSAGDREFWVSELQAGQASNTGLKYSPHVRGKDIRSWVWLGVTEGAKAVLFWEYRPEVTAIEAGCFGLVRQNGQLTERAREASRIGNVLQKYERLYRNYKPREEVGILFDHDNSLLAYAMEADEEVVISSYRGYHTAMWESDVFVRYLKPEELSSWTGHILILPLYLIVDDVLIENLVSYVKSGGTLIVEPGFGWFDHDGKRHNANFPPGMEEVCGLVPEEPYYTNPGNYPTEEEIYHAPLIPFTSPVPCDVRARVFLTPLELRGAESIARYNGLDVSAYNTFGKGEVYYMGTNVGYSIHHGDEGGRELLKHIVRSEISPRVKGSRLRPRLIESERESLLVIFNAEKESVREVIELPKGYEVVSAISGISENSGKDGDRIEVEVDSEDVAVFLLERVSAEL